MRPHAVVHVHEKTCEFHMTNGLVSYICKADATGRLLQLYFGESVEDRDDFGYLVEIQRRSTASCPIEGNSAYSLEHLRSEFPEYGTSDYRMPAISVRQVNGSAVTELRYAGYRIMQGKPALDGLPSTYADDPSQVVTLEIDLVDTLIGLTVTLSYSMFDGVAAVTRSARVRNDGQYAVDVERMMSLSLDLPDDEYDMVQLTGSWARERNVYRHPLHTGMQQIGSLRGTASGHVHNPAFALVRPDTTERAGDAIGVAFVYSGNFEAHVEVDPFAVSRIQMGIADFGFSWHLEPQGVFQAPEVVLSFTRTGLSGMSQTFHEIVRRHLVRGPWRDRERPVLINNWEATYFDFDEDKLVSIASKARDAGIELFVLDDGWFGERCGDTSGLGDWTPNPDRLPDGLGGLARRINDMGMMFGLWFEPEMVNMDSDMYRTHPEWMLSTPGRSMCHGRNQYVLNFANPDVVDNIYQQMAAVLASANIAYIKWDMNRYMTEAFDATRSAEHQGEVFHRYILGMYELNERLLATFPDLIIEGCASGGGRFDLGMLHYCPQIWASDDTDAVERMRIQYGTSMFYPLSSIGAHVSMVPNHQTNRVTSLNTRTNVALFGTFGYELDLGRLSVDEFDHVCEDVAFFKAHRELLHTGTFHRLVSPFESTLHREGKTAWMVVAPDASEAIVGDYLMLAHPMSPFSRLPLRGLDPKRRYRVRVRGGSSSIDGMEFNGDELMRIGMIDSDATTGSSSGEVADANDLGAMHDFDSRLFILTAI